MSRDRYQNYWVCGVYNDGKHQRAELYVVSLMAFKTATFPEHLVIEAIKEVDRGIERFVNQPLDV